MGAWSTWSNCPVTCGGAFVGRSRKCIDGTAGQLGCQGDRTETKECGTFDCRK